MTLDHACQIIWLPDHHPLTDVAEAAEAVLADPESTSAEFEQAAYLITTYRRSMLSAEEGAPRTV